VNILALDCGTKTGWATNAGGSIKSGVQDFSLKRGESTGMQLLRFETWLKTMLIFTDAKMIVYESAHMRKYATAIISLQSYITALILLCEKEGIKYEPVESKVIKKHATGKGNAKKEAMLRVAQELFGQHIESQDEADALLILDWAREEFDKGGGK